MFMSFFVFVFSHVLNIVPQVLNVFLEVLSLIKLARVSSHLNGFGILLSWYQAMVV
jgi:hypothetical protein